MIRGLFWLAVVAAVVAVAAFGFGLPILRTIAASAVLLFVFFYGHTRGQRAAADQLAHEIVDTQQELRDGNMGIVAVPRREG